MDRLEYIYSNLEKHYDEVVAMGYEVFVVVLQGSQNYNLDIYTDEYKSDIDTKAIILPSFDNFCRNSQPLSHTHVRENEEHIDLKDIRVMFETFKKQNVNFVEVLFSPYYIVNPKYADYWYKIRQLGEDLVHCHPAQTLKTMAGQSCEKLKALCHPYPSILPKIEKYGYDGKQLHHILRINLFMKNYLKGLSFAKCLTERTPDQNKVCMRAKLNQYSLEDACNMAEWYHKETEQMKNDFIEKNGQAPITTEPYERLDALKVEILRSWFRAQLLSNDN